MLDRQKIKALKNKLTELMDREAPQLLAIYPLTTYMAELDAYPEIGGYGYVSETIQRFCSRIIDTGGESVLELYHKLLLVTLILNFEERSKRKFFTTEVVKHYHMNFQRIVRDIESDTGRQGFYLYSNDKFCKDLAVCSLRMIPVGAFKMHLNEIPKRVLAKGGIRQSLRLLIFIIFELKGVKPLYELHLDSHDANLMAQYTAEGRRHTFMRVSEMLRLNRQVKGVFSTTWYFDPDLEKISPRLNHARELYLQNGGKLFYVGTNQESINDAILKSPTRRRLFYEGKYTPKNYMAIWPRKRIMQWASKQPEYVDQPDE